MAVICMGHNTYVQASSRGVTFTDTPLRNYAKSYSQVFEIGRIGPSTRITPIQRFASLPVCAKTPLVNPHETLA